MSRHLADKRRRLLDLEEHCRDLLEQLYSFEHAETCPYAALVEDCIVRRRELTLKRLRDVEEEMGHVYTRAA